MQLVENFLIRSAIRRQNKPFGKMLRKIYLSVEPMDRETRHLVEHEAFWEMMHDHPELAEIFAMFLNVPMSPKRRKLLGEDLYSASPRDRWRVIRGYCMILGLDWRVYQQAYYR